MVFVMCGGGKRAGRYGATYSFYNRTFYGAGRHKEVQLLGESPISSCCTMFSLPSFSFPLFLHLSAAFTAVCCSLTTSSRKLKSDQPRKLP